MIGTGIGRTEEPGEACGNEEDTKTDLTQRKCKPVLSPPLR